MIEKNGCLGGVWTAGLLCWILDSNNKSGITQEIREHPVAGFGDRLTAWLSGFPADRVEAFKPRCLIPITCLDFDALRQLRLPVVLNALAL